MGSRNGRRHASRSLVLGGAAALLVATLLAWMATQSPGKEKVFYAELPGIDVSGLEPADVAAVVARASRRRCTCGCGFALVECRHKDVGCDKSRPPLERVVEKYRRWRKAMRTAMTAQGRSEYASGVAKAVAGRID